MKKISLVTARVVRENEQYSYKLIGKREKYLVLHEDGENAGDKAMAYLTPFAKEPVQIEQVILQKNTVEILGGDVENEDKFLYKATVEFIEVNESTGKERKITRTYYVGADDVQIALNHLVDYLNECMETSGLAGISSIVRTKVIEAI